MMGQFRFYNIHKAFGARTLLDIDELSLEPAQCTALTGDNGAGKTTLMKILAGLEAPQQAQLSHDNRPVQSWQQLRKTLRREVIYLHQFAYMFDASVIDNVAYGLARQGLTKTLRQQRAYSALEQLGLAHLAPANAKHLSGGERQRVALARALVLDPKLLLLDEPTASMDAEGRAQLIPLLKTLREEGLASVIVSHDVSSLGNLPDRYLHLDGGKLGEVEPESRLTHLAGNHNNIYSLPLAFEWRGANV